MRSTDDIRRLFKKAELRIRPDADEQVFKDVLQAQQRITENLPPSFLAKARAGESMWRIIMKSPLTKLAVAASVAVACLIGLSLWRGMESGIALADVLARVEKVKVVRYKWTCKMTRLDPDPNKPPLSWEIHATSLESEEYGLKENWETVALHSAQETFVQEKYNLPQKKIWILISAEPVKTYMRKEKELNDASDKSKHKLDSYARDPFTLLKGILNTKYESLGRSTMDGIEVAGFRTTDPNWGGFRRGKESQGDTKIWVDVKTLLPVRYDDLISDEIDEGGERRKWINHMVVYDFQWDVSVDPAEFEPPPVPDGYKIGDNFPDLADEETAIQGLKQCIELLGNYPERIALSYLWSGVEKSETPAALRLKEELKGLTGFDRDQKKMDALKPMRFLNKFYRGPASNDSAYYGETVTPKDTDKVLMRWKLSDSEYRVIYGDLHAETITPEKLAELEAALPK